MDAELSSSSPEERNNVATNAILPEKSISKYNKVYENFNEWCDENNITNITENSVLAYYKSMSETKKASTMWSSYSMLRACLSIYKDIDISKYFEVTAFLKRMSQDYQPKKSRILEYDDVNKFITKADDDTFLAMKVVLIMGYCGGCRRDQLTNMRMDNVEIKTDIITVKVPKTKTDISRIFAITEESWISIVKNYVQQRPSHTPHNRFFLTYRRGRCTTSPIGINKIAEVPKNIAKFLKLPNPELYTGLCFRRSSASHLANQGGDVLTIKKHGVWKSSNVAGFTIKEAQTFSLSPQAQASSSTSTTDATVIKTEPVDDEEEIHRENIFIETHQAGNVRPNEIVISGKSFPGITISANNNTTITVNIYNHCTSIK